jgi:hypothetical protein
MTNVANLRSWTRTLCLLGALSLAGGLLRAAEQAPATGTEQQTAAKTKQLIVWTSDDREVALKMVFMYAYNCKKRGWMDQVRLLVWGPSGRLLTEDKELQDGLKGLKDEGVELYACKGCADLYGISDKMTALGINVMYTGTLLADAQKDGWHVLTF